MTLQLPRNLKDAIRDIVREYHQAWGHVYPHEATSRGNLSDTVVTEQTYGQSATAGVDLTVARGTHTHGTPPAPTPGVDDFLELTDTPDDYFGQSGQVVAVKATEDGLEFISPGAGSADGTELQHYTRILDANYAGSDGDFKLLDTGQGTELYVSLAAALGDNFGSPISLFINGGNYTGDLSTTGGFIGGRSVVIGEGVGLVTIDNSGSSVLIDGWGSSGLYIRHINFQDTIELGSFYTTDGVIFLEGCYLNNGYVFGGGSNTIAIVIDGIWHFPGVPPAPGLYPTFPTYVGALGIDDSTGDLYETTDAAGNWGLVSTGGSGDVVGPGIAVDGDLALFDGTSGALIKDGGPPFTQTDADALYEPLDATIVRTGDTDYIDLTDGGATTLHTHAGTHTHVDSEVPSGTVNGSNVTFTLAATPAAGSLHLYQNGVRLKATDDYSLATATITFVTAPLTGDKLLADYTT